MGKIKIYLVKREVRAKTIAEALKKKGVIYEVTETKDEPLNDKKEAVGFKKRT